MTNDRKIHASVQKIYETHSKELENYVRAKYGAGPPEPDEVVHSAFAKFVIAFQSGIIRNPRAFLYASVRNLIIDHKRREKTRDGYASDIQHIGGEENSGGISPERVLIEKERFTIMRSAIRTLPEQERRVLLMHRLQSLTYAQIAHDMGMSESAVRRAVASAVAHIDAAMKLRGA